MITIKKITKKNVSQEQSIKGWIKEQVLSGQAYYAVYSGNMFLEVFGSKSDADRYATYHNS